MPALAVVLAAGAGRKFWPYSVVRNKCAFPIANEPVVARLVRQLREAGFDRIIVVTGYRAGSVRAALRPLAGDDLVIMEQPAGLAGTAAATSAALRSASACDSHDNTLVVYGDVVVSTEDIRAVWNAVNEQKAPAAALCTPLNGERAQDWIGGSIDARAEGATLLRNIEGHGRDASHRLAGVYALSPAAYPYLRAQPEIMSHVPVGGMPPAESEQADSLATMCDDGLEVAAVEADRPCVDLDKPWHILEATRIVLEERGRLLVSSGSSIAPDAEVSDGAEIDGPIVVESGAVIGKRVVIKGPAWIGAGAKVVNGAILGHGVTVGERSRVSDYCLVGSGSVVGRECVVGHGAEFDGVMLDRGYIYHYSEIYGVLGEAVDIGAATVCGTLRFDDADAIHRIQGRRELPKIGANATYFGDYSRTGVNVITQPGIKIGAYSCVGPGIVLYADVPDRKLMLLKQEVVEKDWGPDRYGW